MAGPELSFVFGDFTGLEGNIGCQIYIGGGGGLCPPPNLNIGGGGGLEPPQLLRPCKWL